MNRPSQNKAIVLYMHVHQPDRIRSYSVFDTAYSHDYFDDSRNDLGWSNQAILEKVAEKSYRPMNKLLAEMLESNPDFRFSLSITGTFIEQCERWAPDVLASFQGLVKTGRVDIVAETYYHSLAFFYSRAEFERQVAQHREKIQQLFGVTPQVFRNTELAYNNDLAEWADKSDYKGILAEGWDPILGWRSPNYVYSPVGTSNLKLLLKNYRLSDDIAFRFSDRKWKDWPLGADRYIEWLRPDNENEQLVNLFVDYETFGEHQWADTGIFDFMKQLVPDWSGRGGRFMTVTEATEFEPADTVDMPQTVTWADTERDLTAWLGNSMQQEALYHLYALEEEVLRTGDMAIIADWRKLQTSDHVYYMCTKWFSDGDVHAYFSPYSSPCDAFMYFMNALRDLRWRILEHNKKGGVTYV